MEEADIYQLFWCSYWDRWLCGSTWKKEFFPFNRLFLSCLNHLWLSSFCFRKMWISLAFCMGLKIFSLKCEWDDLDITDCAISWMIKNKILMSQSRLQMTVKNSWSRHNRLHWKVFTINMHGWFILLISGKQMFMFNISKWIAVFQ